MTNVQQNPNQKPQDNKYSNQSGQAGKMGTNTTTGTTPNKDKDTQSGIKSEPYSQESRRDQDPSRTDKKSY